MDPVCTWFQSHILYRFFVSFHQENNSHEACWDDTKNYISRKKTGKAWSSRLNKKYRNSIFRELYLCGCFCHAARLKNSGWAVWLSMWKWAASRCRFSLNISTLPAHVDLSISCFLTLSYEMMNQLTLTTKDRWFAAKVSHTDLTWLAIPIIPPT